MNQKITKNKKPTIKQLQSQLQDLDTQYKRALADYQNLIKQTQKERQDYLQYSNSTLITQLLPLLDNLQTAQQHLRDQGLEMIIKQFQQTIADERIIEIKPKQGDIFDTQTHEAIDTVETKNPKQENQIAETVLIGYQYQDGSVLRHAKVKVYKCALSDSGIDTD